jgi:hypothetical protein
MALPVGAKRSFEQAFPENTISTSPETPPVKRNRMKQWILLKTLLHHF